MSNRKVIQIYSPSRGGSTFLSFMLVNGTNGIAPGDIAQLFRSTAETHKRTSCVCTDPDCSIWADVKEQGEEDFYESLFGQGYNLIADSAKKLNWYRDQKEYYDKPIGELIIFKSPAEHGRSYWKRTHKLNLSFYVNYYTNTLAQTEDPILVEYADLAQNPSSTLRKVCQELDIDYFEGKELFWEKEDWHSWGGSNTAMIHFFDKGTQKYKQIVKGLEETQDGQPAVLKHYREIYYSNSGRKLPDWAYQHIKSENGLLPLYRYMQKLKV